MAAKEAHKREHVLGDESLYAMRRALEKDTGWAELAEKFPA